MERIPFRSNFNIYLQIHCFNLSCVMHMIDIIILGLIKVLKDDIQWVHVFVIAFKQTDNRLTSAFYSMLDLFQKMFGSKFWDNAIIAATHWHYHNGSIKTRMRDDPQITEEFWTAQINNVLRSDFNIKQVR